MINQPNTPQRPASFGSVQETFRYRLRNLVSGDQFTIVEDMPRNKQIRFEMGKGKAKDGREFDSKTYIIRVVVRGYEADMEVYEKELPKLAVLCPKGLENFKGCTFIHDGYNWAYLGIETPQAPISNISQAMTPRDPRQPDLNPASDQRDVFVARLTAGITTLAALGNKVDAAVVMKVCDNITPGNGMDLFAYAKGKGAISETNGEWKAN